MIKVKVCGITNFEDASKAAFYGAYALGFNFYKKSPRYISPSKAKKIIEMLPPFVTPVGVFVNQSERAVKDIINFTNIRTVQFHGDEKPVYCKRFTNCKIIKAFRVRDYGVSEIIEKYKVDAYLFDAYQESEFGGTGKTFGWEFFKGKKFDRPVILSGGLNPSNISDAIDTVNPFAVDVASGLEKSPGIKDGQKIREFFNVINSKFSS